MSLSGNIVPILSSAMSPQHIILSRRYSKQCWRWNVKAVGKFMGFFEVMAA
jgi:hypothetical protein